MKVLIISHENDIDGMGNIVLAKLAFEDFDYHLSLSISTLEKKFRTLLNDGTLAGYDRIYITDLALDNPSLEMVGEDPELRNKVLIFDHHVESKKRGLDTYDFTHIDEIGPDGKHKCGTQMFYEYLQSEGLISKTPALETFVEMTRLEDTWDWTKSGELGVKAHDLAILFSALGIEDYIANMYRHVKENTLEFSLSDEENAIVEIKKEEYKDKLRTLWEDTSIFTDEFGNTYGAVFADYQYRNDLAEYIRSLDDQKGIKYIIIIALEKGIAGQKSYRSIEPDFDVNEIASLRGGGGHKLAASTNITTNQKAKSLTLEKRESLEYLSKSSFSN